MARLAFDIILWTARRPTDASLISIKNRCDPSGRQNDNGRYLKGVDSKTGKKWKIRISNALQTSMATSTNGGNPTCIVNAHGNTFSGKGFNNRFAKWVKIANLPDRCRAHGLRKAHMRRLAEAGTTQQQLKAIDSEVTVYVADANKSRLTDIAMDLLEKNH